MRHLGLHLAGFLAVAAGLLGSGASLAQTPTCAAGTKVSDTCDGLGFEGCCSGNSAVWCETASGPTCLLDCSASLLNPHCGWSTSGGFYDCVDTPEQVDPAGQAPAFCGMTIEGSCGAVGIEGCCGQTTLKFCWGGFLHAADCAGSSDPAKQQCGWDPAPGFYSCTSSSAEDPAGLVLRPCPGGACSPSCAGKQCGGDGCGGGCGDCPAGWSCVSGLCEISCVPSCAGKGCGADGCGGSCGDCPAGWSCVAGICEAICVPSCAGKGCGGDGCGGSCGSCDPFSEACNDQTGTCECLPSCILTDCGDDGCGGSCGTCAAGETCVFGFCLPDSGCTPSCAGKSCGEDGCGGTCGACSAGSACAAGICTPICQPDCAGKGCGEDGCGGTCGSCGPGTICQSATCVALPAPDACTPSCADRDCGDDGCGGSCGHCGVGTVCGDGGSCEACAPQCAGRECGDDGCGEVCGYCGTGEECSEAGFCIEEGCLPYCPGRDCGDDGCGGLCGICEPGLECLPGGLCGVRAMNADAGSGPEDSGASAGADGASFASPPDPGGAARSWSNPCPAGQVLMYGHCMLPSRPAPGISEVSGQAGGKVAASGCTASGSPGGSGPALPLALLGLLLLWVRELASSRARELARIDSGL